MISKEFLAALEGKIAVAVSAGHLMETKAALTLSRYVSSDGKYVTDTYVNMNGDLWYQTGLVGTGQFNIAWSEAKPAKE